MTSVVADLGASFIADLGAVMSGPLATLAGGLVIEDERRTVAGPALLDGAMIGRIVHEADQSARAPDRRAVLSVWALEYFEMVTPPVLSAAIWLDRQAAPAFEQARFVVDECGRIEALRLAEMPLVGSRRFDPFIIGHLAPFIAHVGHRSAVSARVLWSNAGHIFEVFLGMLERERGDHEGIREARALIASPMLAGTGNPLFQPVRYESGRRVRRVCCLRFLVPEWRICAICPLPPTHPSRTR